MKLPSVTSKLFTYDYWQPVFSIQPDGTYVLTYHFVERRSGALTARIGGAINLISDEQMEIDSEVRDVRGSDGVAPFVVSGNPYNLFVTKVDPIFNIYGELTGWRHALARSAD